MIVYMCSCLLVQVCVEVYMMMSDDTLECHSGAPSTPFETKPLIGLELTNEVGLVASKPEGSICCCPPPQHWGYKCTPLCPAFFLGFECGTQILM